MRQLENTRPTLRPGRRKRAAFRAVGLWVVAALIVLALTILFGLPRGRRTAQGHGERPPTGLEAPPDERPSGGIIGPAPSDKNEQRANP